jgi:hypothetical protein
MKKIIFVFIFICISALSAQNIGNIGRLPVVEAPKQPCINVYNYQSSNPNNVYNPNELNDIQKRNQELFAEIDAEIRTEYRRQMMIKQLLTEGFPSNKNDLEGVACFERSFNEIQEMLEGNQPLNLARAIFLVENAYYGESLDYKEYTNFIEQKVQLCNQKIAEDKLNAQNNTVKNMMLFRLISDTLTFKETGSEKETVHLPVKYDYDDYRSAKSFDSHFVTKLMRTGVGQCYSMPLYYLVLSEALEAEAYWSFSPRHTFVKIKDEKGVWYNLELTCNSILSDAHYMNNSYIKAEAIRNKLYLEPLDKENVIAEMLLNLSRYYYVKYGMDDFYLQCIETAERHLDNKLDAITLKATYQTRLTLVLADLLNAPNPEILKQKSPEAYTHYEKMHELYKQIDDLGFEELPDELYARWLEHIAKEKEMSEHNKILILNEIK